MDSDMLHLLSCSLFTLHFILKKDVATIPASFPVTFCRSYRGGWDTMCFFQMATLDGVPALQKKKITQPCLGLGISETVKTVE